MEKDLGRYRIVREGVLMVVGEQAPLVPDGVQVGPAAGQGRLFDRAASFESHANFCLAALATIAAKVRRCAQGEEHRLPVEGVSPGRAVPGVELDAAEKMAREVAHEPVHHEVARPIGLDRLRASRRLDVHVPPDLARVDAGRWLHARRRVEQPRGSQQHSVRRNGWNDRASV